MHNEGNKQSLAADEHINVVCDCIDLANIHIVYRECGDSWYVSAQTQLMHTLCTENVVIRGM